MVRLMMLVFCVVSIGSVGIRFLPSGNADTIAITNGEVQASSSARVLVSTGPFRQVAQKSATYQITVRANEFDAYGRSWDGIGGGGTLALPGLLLSLPGNSPPDLMLCVVYDSEMECHHTGERHAPDSLCPDSFKCTWTITVPEGRAFGIIVVDLDWSAPYVLDANDLVDAVIVAEKNQSVDGLNAPIRLAMQMVSRTRLRVMGFSVPITIGEERRRGGSIPSLHPQACHSVVCPLAQSEIQIERL